MESEIKKITTDNKNLRIINEILGFILTPIIKIGVILISFCLSYIRYFFATGLAVIYFVHFAFITEIFSIEEFAFSVFRFISKFYPINIRPEVNVPFSEILKVIFIASIVLTILSKIIKLILKKVFKVETNIAFKKELKLIFITNTIIHTILFILFELFYVEDGNYVIFVFSYIVSTILILLSMSFGYLSKVVLKLIPAKVEINIKNLIIE